MDILDISIFSFLVKEMNRQFLEYAKISNFIIAKKRFSIENKTLKPMV
ncbi:MAG: hypothetical protein ACI9TO_001192 [Rickettsiales bacterium]|jgi:hypothetical protein